MSVKRDMAKGATWLILLRLVIRSISLVSTLILARLLVPADFGLVAMAVAVITLIEMLGDFGFQVYLVQKKNLTKEDLDAAWTIQASLAILEALLLAVLAAPLANFYDEPRLAPVIWVLSVNTLLLGFRNVGVIYFQRELLFHLEFYLKAACKIVGFLATVFLAWVFRNYWALVIGSVVYRFTDIILSYMLHPHRPRFRLTGCREILSFSKWIYFNTTLGFFGQRLPDFVVGKIAGAASLGLFSVGYSIALLPTTEMASPINRASFPGYAKMRDDIGKVQDGYLSVLGIIAVVSLPAGLGIAATAEVLVPFLLGDKWLEAVPVVKCLAFMGALGSLQTNALAVYQGQGCPWVITCLSVIRVSLLLPLLVIFTLHWGVVGAALAYLLVAVIMNPIGFGVAVSRLKLKISRLINVLYRPIFSSVVMYLVVSIWLSPVAESLDFVWDGLEALMLVLSGAVIYMTCVLGLWLASGKPAASAEAVVIQMIKEQVLRRFTALTKKAEAVS